MLHERPQLSVHPSKDSSTVILFTMQASADRMQCVQPRQISGVLKKALRPAPQRAAQKTSIPQSALRGPSRVQAATLDRSVSQVAEKAVDAVDTVANAVDKTVNGGPVDESILFQGPMHFWLTR